MSTPRPHDYSSEKCWCGEINPLVKYPPKEGVAAPLEPLTASDFHNSREWVERKPKSDMECLTEDGYWLAFAEMYAAAVSKNLQEELARIKKLFHDLTPGGSEFVNDAEYCARYLREKSRTQHDITVKTIKHAQAAETKILRLEKEITALRETK